MTSAYSINLNFNNTIPVKTDFTFKQGDKGITLNLATTGLDPTGTTAHIVFKRSNGTSVEAELTGQSGPTYSYTILGNEFEIPGVVVADLKLYNGDTQRVSTASFIFLVTGDTMDGVGGGTGGYSDQLEQLSAEFQDTLDDYIDAFGNTAPINPRGDYDNTATYEPRDMVYDPNTGTSWVAKVQTTGHAPASPSSYWQKLVNSSGSANLGDLADVTFTSLADGQVPTYNGTSHEWENKNIPAGSFAGLSDVSVSGVTDGQIPKYNGTSSKWEAVAPPSIPAKTSDLSDVASTAPTNGQILKYNGTSQKYEPANESGGGGGSQPNLLINPWFTVNQRGLTSGTAQDGKYGLDRWAWVYSYSAGTYSISSSGLTLTASSVSDQLTIKQPFESSVSDLLNGKEITASVMLSDGTIKSGTITRTAGTSQTFFGTTTSGDLKVDLNSQNVFLVRNYGSSITIRAVKLEIGSTSTLHLDTAPDYSTELLKCQRYFVRIAGSIDYAICFALGNGAVSATAFINLSTPMRTTPAISYSTLYLRDISGSGANYDISTASVSAYSLNMITLNLMSSGLTALRLYLLRFKTDNGYIDFSAEL